VRPKTKEPGKAEPANQPEPQVAQGAKPAPRQEAAAFAAPPSNGMISGAQPVVPAGSFNSRWGM
jgi:hypothetical protein